MSRPRLVLVVPTAVIVVAITATIVLVNTRSPKVHAPSTPAEDARLGAAPLADTSALEPRVARAVADRLAATEAAPDDPMPRVFYGVVLHANALLEPAVEAYAQVLAVEPQRANIRYFRALALDELGRSDEALREHLQAAELLPEDAAVLARLGFRYLERGDHDAAGRAFAAALRGDPMSLPARIGAARHALATDQPADARRLLEDLRTSHPEERYVRYLLGLACRALGDDACARTELEAGAGGRLDWRGHDRHVDLLRQYRAGYEATLQQAAARIQRGEPALAIALLEALLQERPGDLPAIMVLADAHRAAGDLDAAIALLESALAFEGNQYATELNLGHLFDLRGETARGLGHARRAVELHPSFAPARAQLGRLLLKLGRAAEAEQEAAEAVRLAPDSVEALTLLGYAQLALGRTDDAAATFTLLIERRPDQPDGYLHLANLHAASGREAAARRVLQDARPRFPGDSRIANALRTLGGGG